MKIKIKVEKELEIKTLHIMAGVRYWEDAKVDGVEDTDGNLIPCRKGDVWDLMIDIETGKIINWKEGVKADIHYKVCDQFAWELLDENGLIILSEPDGYVADCMCPKGQGYGDYIIMDISEGGEILNWKFRINDFSNED